MNGLCLEIPALYSLWEALLVPLFEYHKER